MTPLLAISALATVLSTATLAAEPLTGFSRFHFYGPNLAGASQPTAAQIAAIAAAGYKVVINVAAPQSNPDALPDEKRLVEAAGMQYHYFPISWEKPDPRQLVEVVNLLETLKDTPVLVHCYVNSRSSLVAYLHRTARAGLPEAEERQLMTRLWRLNPGYEFENSRQWHAAVSEAKGTLAQRGP